MFSSHTVIKTSFDRSTKSCLRQLITRRFDIRVRRVFGSVDITYPAKSFSKHMYCVLHTTATSGGNKFRQQQMVSSAFGNLSFLLFIQLQPLRPWSVDSEYSLYFPFEYIVLCSSCLRVCVCVTCDMNTPPINIKLANGIVNFIWSVH